MKSLNAHRVASLDILANVNVVYETFKGWKSDISNCRTFDELPENAKRFITSIESHLCVPGNHFSFILLVKWIGVGPHRNEMILK